MFGRQVNSPERINLLCDDVEQHYHVIVNTTGAMSNKYYINHVTKHAELTQHIAVTRHVVIEWLELRASSPPS